MTIKLYVTCAQFTVKVVAEGDLAKDQVGAFIIKDTGPIAKKFIGRPVRDLCNWARKFGFFDVQRIG